MLSGRHIHLHQALGLGPMWLPKDVTVIDVVDNVKNEPVTQVPQQNGTLLETKIPQKTALLENTTSKPAQTQQSDLVTQETPISADAVKHKVSKRAAALLAHIAHAQLQKPVAALKKSTTNDNQDTAVIDYSQDHLPDLIQKISGCTQCNLAQGRRQALTPKSIGDCRLIVVLPQPSLQDDQEGRLLSDNEAVMDLWDKLTRHALGLKPEQIYLTSAIKCAPNLELVAKQHHAASCSPYLRRELQLLPAVPVLMLAENQQSLWQRLQEWTAPHRVFRIPHPSKMVRNPATKRMAWETLQQLKTLL